MSRTLILYTTAGCHLCEQAKAMVWPELNRLGWQLQEVDIADSNELIDRYGVRIPVVALIGSSGELGWPFDQQQFARFVRDRL